MRLQVAGEAGEAGGMAGVKLGVVRGREQVRSVNRLGQPVQPGVRDVEVLGELSSARVVGEDVRRGPGQ